ncbi:MAG: hypothetical protein EOM53_04600 [Alphaproteobacteria bacterium]|nr:tetratricopeptide repeat protein [Alphaproteobacteria bacterium]NCB49937.1 hypothetical protein [Alphaproteobacteria bacterium]
MINKEAMVKLRQEVKKPEEDWDLMNLVLLLAQIDMPSLSLGYSKLHLRELSENFAEEMGYLKEVDDVELLSKALHQTLFETARYTFSPLLKPSSLNMIQVIKRHSCHPYMMMLFYKYLCDKMNVENRMLSFSNELILEVEDKKANRFFIDIGKEGQLLSQKDMALLFLKNAASREEEGEFETLNKKDFLLKIQKELKNIYFNQNNMTAVLKTLQTMLVLSPYDALLWKEDAALQTSQNNIKQAIWSLETYLAFSKQMPNSMTEKQDEDFLQNLQKSLN